MPDTNAQAFHHAQQVKDRIAPNVMQIPGVLSIGVGVTPAQEPCLVILTNVRVPDTQERLSRELDRLGLDDVPVMTRVAGEFRAISAS